MPKLKFKNSKYTVVSLFSGCGGSDLGILGRFNFLGKKYSRLPTEVVYANDIDKQAAETFSLNFKAPISTQDIKEVTTEQVGQHDILIGGFPCQPFSMVGMRKGLADFRGQLFHEITRFLRDLKPLAFIGENVKGLSHWSKGEALRIMIEEFQNAGYRVKAKILNAADFGVPQKRERIFIVGFHNSLEHEFEFPEPTHNLNGENNKSPWVPLKSVIKSLIPENPKYYFSKRAVEGLKKANKAFNKGRAQSLDKPCNTINSHLAKVSLNGTDPVLLVDAERELYRRFSPREAASIQSFPDNFKFAGGDLDAYRQIGNAVPPVLMWYVSNALILQLNAVLEKQNRRDDPFIQYPLFEAY